MGLLNGSLVLHGVDIEPLLWRVLNDSNVTLRPHERDDCIAWLLGVAWELSERFDPGRGVAFSTFCYSTCRRRVIDFVRAERGRWRWQFAGQVHERARPEFVSLDDERRGLDRELVAGGGMGDGGDRLPDRLRLLRERSSAPARYAAAMDRRAARRAAI